jgi:hypothetical protein
MTFITHVASLQCWGSSGIYGIQCLGAPMPKEVIEHDEGAQATLIDASRAERRCRASPRGSHVQRAEFKQIDGKGRRTKPVHPRQPPAREQRYGLRLTQCSSRSHTLSIRLDSNRRKHARCLLHRTAHHVTRYVNSMHLNALFCKCSSRLQLKECAVPVRWNGPSSSMYKSEQESTGPLPAQTSTIRVFAWKVCKGNRIPSIRFELGLAPRLLLM